MAVTIQDPLSALVFFFVAVILVILGTYLLFITGITAMLKLLKKNKRFYYKTNHFTALSGMLFRMKQNAAGLASICVLFTALLVTCPPPSPCTPAWTAFSGHAIPGTCWCLSVTPTRRPRTWCAPL